MPKVYSKRFEDYLETIYNIIKRKGYARTKDISRELGVRPPSVTEMLNKLKRHGFVNYERYGGVTLTERGSGIGKAVKNRHDTIKKFLEILLISEKVADKDACRLEHDLSPETVEQLTKFVGFMATAPAEPKWREHFKMYCITGEHECREAKK